jgi:hypothetical protein
VLSGSRYPSPLVRRADACCSVRPVAGVAAGARGGLSAIVPVSRLSANSGGNRAARLLMATISSTAIRGGSIGNLPLGTT